MSKQPAAILWDAQPHTIAKIKILENYLLRWFEILGRTPNRSKRDLWYIDGFAGPGEYTNAQDGSPIAALGAAEAALRSAANNWLAGKINCVFIEQHTGRFQHLQQKVNGKYATVTHHFINSSFVDGIAELQKLRPNPFLGASPLFTFIDPFGATGAPFSVVKSLLSLDTSEVLINFDSDGVGRIRLAEESAGHEVNLNSIFGDDSWTRELVIDRTANELYQSVLRLYKKKLLEIPGVRYVFAFEMRSPSQGINYHLVFASKHYLGLEKMKEAMKALAQNGEYAFSSSGESQPMLFKFDEPEDHAQQLRDVFRGRTLAYDELRDYALNESPFTNPKAMLKLLEEKGQISVSSTNPKRRRGTFPDADKSLRISILN